MCWKAAGWTPAAKYHRMHQGHACLHTEIRFFKFATNQWHLTGFKDPRDRGLIPNLMWRKANATQTWNILQLLLMVNSSHCQTDILQKLIYKVSVALKKILGFWSKTNYWCKIYISSFWNLANRGHFVTLIITKTGTLQLYLVSGSQKNIHNCCLLRLI